MTRKSVLLFSCVVCVIYINQSIVAYQPSFSLVFFTIIKLLRAHSILGFHSFTILISLSETLASWLIDIKY